MFERAEAVLASTGDAVIEELRLLGATFLAARDNALLRELAMSEGQRLGHGSGTSSVDRAVADLRSRLGIHSDEDLSAWLTANDTTIERFADLGRAESQLAKLRWSGRDGSHLLDVLRVDDRYRTLAQRAQDKAALLSDLDGIDPTAHLSDEEVLTWYFDRLGPFYRRDASAHASTYGFADRAQFVAVVRREYAYLQRRDSASGSGDAAAL
jgi:hypothetical protein